MKTYSSELHDLVKSLSTQEKKRIRKEMSLTNKNKKIVLLYDIIDKQNFFDEALIQKKLGNPKWYPGLKKYLLEYLTDKIYCGNSDKKSKTYLLKLITIAEQFHTKGLIKATKKKLIQALDLCKENSWIEYAPIINSKLDNIIGEKAEQRKSYTFYTESYRALNQAYLEKKYSILFRCLEHSDKTIQAPEFMAGLSIDECLSDEKHLTTFHQKLHYYQFLSAYYRHIELNYSQSYFYAKKSMEVILKKNKEEENMEPFSQTQQNARERSNMVQIYNLIAGAINANFLDDLYTLFKSYVLLRRKFNIRKGHILHKLYNELYQSLCFLISAVNITRRGVESPDFHSHLHQFYLIEKKLPYNILVVCNEMISFYFFMKRDWNNCTSTINKILNDNELYKIYPETYANMLLLRLFVNYETDDLDVLDYNLKRTERYFEKHYSALGYEKIVIAFFNEIVNDFSGRIKTMQKYMDKINELLLNDRNFSFTYLTEKIFIDFKCWLDSKITNRMFTEILKEKKRNKN
ncbi:MAG: hypothetical protein HYU69_00505 [Bacteroidetes bacterium]|nr:hypothetical protein [Bacteroidota bacterium]